MTEIWLPVSGWETRLEVSNLGRVRALPFVAVSKRANQPTQRRAGGLLKPDLGHNGYLTVCTRVQVKTHKQLLHRLVGKAFVPGYFVGASIDHLDGNRVNNRADNLQWVTLAENSRRQNADGRGRPSGDKHPMTKLSDANIDEMLKARSTGLSYSQLGLMFNVSGSLAHKVVTGIRRRKSAVAISAAAGPRNA